MDMIEHDWTWLNMIEHDWTWLNMIEHDWTWDVNMVLSYFRWLSFPNLCDVQNHAMLSILVGLSKLI